MFATLPVRNNNRGISPFIIEFKFSLQYLNRRVIVKDPRVKVKEKGHCKVFSLPHSLGFAHCLLDHKLICIMTTSVKCRGFCFTLNNYTAEHELQLAQFATSVGARSSCYLIYGKEVAPTTGTPHLQGYVYFKNARYIGSLIKLNIFGNIEHAMGNGDQNEKYCRKTREQDEVPNEEVLEYNPDNTPKDCVKAGRNGGIIESQRWEDARTAARAGDLDSVPADIYIRCYATIKKIRDDSVLEADLETLDDLDHEWLWGESGSGKSYTARQRYPEAYLKSCNKWWDGYRGHPVVLIEDFDRKHDVLCHHLKIWADRYPFPAEVKGSCIKIRPQKIVVTSNYSPEDIWMNPCDLEPIMRRFKVTKFSGTFIPESVGARRVEEASLDGSSTNEE